MHTEIHSDFRLNGIAFTKKELKEVGYSLVKAGDPHEVHIGDFLMDWLNDKPTVTVQTSGSTGIPKQVEIQKRFMVNSAQATKRFFNLKGGQSALLCLPSNFIAGKMMLVRAMVLGMELDYVEPSSNPLENLEKSYDFCAMVPLQLENSLNKIKQIKTLIIGGAPISAILKKRVQNKPTSIFETYGMTETVTHIAARAINDKKQKPKEPVRNVFRTLQNVKISVDARQCLVIDCPNVAEQAVVTNDVVYIVSESEFEWLGRYDSIINSGGIKLYPERIEEKLAAIISNRFMVAGIPHEKLGQKLVLIFEGDTDSEALLQKMKSLKTLDKFEVPKEIFKVSKFMETENGKIKRKKTLDKISS